MSSVKTEILGHMIDNNGVTADVDKTKVIHEMQTPTNVAVNGLLEQNTILVCLLPQNITDHL
jgi:hypothetical protein